MAAENEGLVDEEAVVCVVGRCEREDASLDSAGTNAEGSTHTPCASGAENCTVLRSSGTEAVEICMAGGWGEVGRSPSVRACCNRCKAPEDGGGTTSTSERVDGCAFSGLDGVAEASTCKGDRLA